MPDFWTHILGGDTILTNLKNDSWKKVIAENRNVFNLGCQGPDFLFYHDFWPWIQTKRGPKIGRILHSTHTKQLFLKSIDYLKEIKDTPDFFILMSYFCGFLSHYVMDKWTHPFVYERTKTSNAHKALEMHLDTYFIKKLWQKDAYLLSPAAMIHIGENLPPSIEAYYRRILSEIYGLPKDIDFLNAAYQDMKRVFNIFYSPSYLKKSALYLLNAVLSIDLTIYIYPFKTSAPLLSESEYQLFYNLFQKGAAEGIQLIGLVENYLENKIEKGKLEAAFYNVSFSGVSID